LIFSYFDGGVESKDGG